MRTVPDTRPIRCHRPGCRQDVAWQIVWCGDPGDFRLTCGTHIEGALQAKETNYLLPYPFATPSQEDAP